MPARPSLDASVRAQGRVVSGVCTLGNGSAVYRQATSGAVSPDKELGKDIGQELGQVRLLGVGLT